LNNNLISAATVLSAAVAFSFRIPELNTPSDSSYEIIIITVVIIVGGLVSAAVAVAAVVVCGIRRRR
jgi:branched-subunit amino acid ABC-type transport system permease component